MFRWGIIGLGEIARVFCNGLRFSKTGRAIAVASRNPAKARTFAHSFSIPTVHGTYDALLADDSVDVVYIANIHPAHLRWVTRAAAVGKHILVEKPMGLNHREVATMIEAARVHDVFLMEGFMYRCHPQMQEMAALIQDGAIGDVKIVQSAFGFKASSHPRARIWDCDLAGGAIMDVGCYPASAVRFVAGVASGQAFLNPIEVNASGLLSDRRVDAHAAAVLKFENGVVAQISTAIDCELPGDITVFGTEGLLKVPNPWLPSTPCRTARKALPLDTVIPGSEIYLQRGGECQKISVAADRDLFTYEADTVAEHILSRQSPAMSWSDSEGNVRLLDQWRSQIGLRFPQDG